MNIYKIAKSNKTSQKIAGIFFAIIAFIAFYFFKDEIIIAAIEFAILGGLALSFFIKSSKALEEPKLISAVRIMLNSGNRDFKFSKSSEISDDIAQFVVKVESTLSAYHKNHS